MQKLIDRRRWLATGLGGVAGWAAAQGAFHGVFGGCCSGGAGRAAGAAESAPPRLAGKVKKAVKYHMIAERLSLGDKFKLLRELGYDGVEIRTADQVDKQAARQASEAANLPIHGVINSSNPDIKSAIELASYWGGDSVLVVIPTDAKGSYLENYRRRQQILRDAVPLAEKRQVKILIENVWASFLIEPLSMARFIDELDSPYVGAYFDVGNNIRWGYAGHWIEVLGKRIGKLDIKEYDRGLQVSEGLRAGFNVEIGEGSVDWPRVRTELDAIGYTGWATAEVPGGDRERLREIARRMDAVLGLA